MNTLDSRNFTISLYIIIILVILNLFIPNFLIQLIITSAMIIIIFLSLSIIVKEKFSFLPKEELFDEEEN